MTELALRAALCEAGRRLWQRGLVSGGAGAISARLDATHMLFTPPDGSLGHLRPDDVLIRNLDEPEEPEASLHALVLRARPDATAIAHAHPPIASGMGLAGVGLPDNLSANSARTLGSVALVGFCEPGPDGFEALRPYLEDHRAFFLTHDGVLTLGADPLDAARRVEAIERHAVTFATAQDLGGYRPVPKELFDQLLQSALHGRVVD